MEMYDLSEMRRQLAALDARREPLVHLIEAAEAYEETVGKTTRIGATVTIHSKPPRAGAADRPLTVMEITENIALEIIEKTGMPAKTRDVVNLMVTRQLPLPNKNLTNVISARLSNSDKLKGRRGLGWWPKDRPWLEDSDLVTAAEVANENGPSEGEPKDDPETAHSAQ